VGGRWRLGRCHSLQVSGGHLSAQKSAYWEANEARHHDLIREGKSDAECATLLGCSIAAARQKRQSYGLEAPSPVLRPVIQRPRISTVLDLDVRPFAVPIAKAPDPKPGKGVTAVIVGDTQYPYHDRRCLSVVEGVLKEVKPDIILHMGDLIDCYQISAYERDPNRMSRLQDDIDGCRTLLHRWAQIVPNARRVLLEGNHEDRLRRLIWSLPGTASELARLRSFQSAMTWPSLLDMDGVGWEWIPGEMQSRTPVLPKLISIHGHQLRGSTTVEGACARKAMTKYGRSVIVGHHHRACIISRRDHNGQAFGIETGCTCLIDGQPWGSDFNWQQAITIGEWSGDHKLMGIQQVHVRDGRARWQGQDYRAA
jgi:predicted phosphodiesterase